VEDVVAFRYRDKGLRSLHASDPVPTAPLVVRGDLPPRVSQSIRDALLELDFNEAKDRRDWDEEIRYGFAPATDADYGSVRDMAGKLSGSCAKGCHSTIEF
jgi:ABC-type phosphate/phosphonate transport system substrate-binding protein